MQTRPRPDLRAIGRRPDPAIVRGIAAPAASSLKPRSMVSIPVDPAPAGPAPVMPIPVAPAPPIVPVGPARVDAPQAPRTERRLWPDHLVQWGVPRKAFRFDIEDPDAHRGRTQHAYALGHDHIAVCGFVTPLVRGFFGGKEPLLALAGPDNPRCRQCAVVILPAPPMVPHVSPYAVERRPDGRTWLDDRLRALGLPHPEVLAAARRRRPVDPPWPEMDRPVPRLSAGALPSSEIVTIHEDRVAIPITG